MSAIANYHRAQETFIQKYLDNVPLEGHGYAAVISMLQSNQEAIVGLKFNSRDEERNELRTACSLSGRTSLILKSFFSKEEEEKLSDTQKDGLQCLYYSLNALCNSIAEYQYRSGMEGILHDLNDQSSQSKSENADQDHTIIDNSQNSSYTLHGQVNTSNNGNVDNLSIQANNNQDYHNTHSKKGNRVMAKYVALPASVCFSGAACYSAVYMPNAQVLLPLLHVSVNAAFALAGICAISALALLYYSVNECNCNSVPSQGNLSTIVYGPQTGHCCVNRSVA